MESKLSIPGKCDLDAQMEACYDSLTGSERSEDAELAGSALASTESRARRSGGSSGVH